MDGESRRKLGELESIGDEQLVDTSLFMRRKRVMELMIELEPGGLSIAPVCFSGSVEGPVI